MEGGYHLSAAVQEGGRLPMRTTRAVFCSLLASQVLAFGDGGGLLLCSAAALEDQSVVINTRKNISSRKFGENICRCCDLAWGRLESSFHKTHSSSIVRTTAVCARTSSSNSSREVSISTAVFWRLDSIVCNSAAAVPATLCMLYTFGCDIINIQQYTI